MPLSPGTTLGSYQVTAKIGEGGMGQVWQATDTQLNRQVALKILPDAFAADPDRLARFQREAQILDYAATTSNAKLPGLCTTRSSSILGVRPSTHPRTASSCLGSIRIPMTTPSTIAAGICIDPVRPTAARRHSCSCAHARDLVPSTVVMRSALVAV